MAKKKSKKEKKAKKSKSSAGRKVNDPEVPRDDGRHDDGAKIVDGGGKSSIPIKLSVSLEPKVSAGGGGWSWGSAFAAASKVQPNDADLDGDFLKATEASNEGDKTELLDISQLANHHRTHPASPNDAVEEEAGCSSNRMKRKRSESSDDDSDAGKDVHSDDVSLEGRMVSLSDDGNTDLTLVLVHKQSGKVYSSGERANDGRRLAIGKIVKGKVELDPIAVKEMKGLEEGDAAAGPSFPYPTNPDDHCETPLQSYEHIRPILNDLRKSFRGDKQSMSIYDPYFCDGSVVRHLASLGFDNVYNKKEDCYAVWKSNAGPKFDVFLTNPPYSDDHIEKLMNHLSSPSFGNKPWLLLMPQWVHKKDYYVNATTKNSDKPCNPFYIVPKKRYVYLPPANFREKKESDTHKKSSPFVSMWYCWGGTEKRNQQMITAFQRSAVAGDCDLARSKSALRDLRRSGGGGKGKKKKARTDKK